MQRYFVSIIDKRVIFDEKDVHHIIHVMRMKINDKIIVIADKKEYLAEIKCLKPLDVKLIVEQQNDKELDIDITLLLSLAKGDKIEFIMQKATELGVNHIVLVRTKNCVTKLSNDDFQRKYDRYYRIVKEASEQCERLIIPSIDGVYNLDNIPSKYLQGLNLLAYERSSSDLKIKLGNSKQVSLLIGPEGGFNSEEVDYLINHGFSCISLGKTILRVETAAISALSVIKYLAS